MFTLNFTCLEFVYVIYIHSLEIATSATQPQRNKPHIAAMRSECLFLRFPLFTKECQIYAIPNRGRSDSHDEKSAIKMFAVGSQRSKCVDTIDLDNIVSATNVY